MIDWSGNLTGDIVVPGDGSIIDCVGDPMPWADVKGDAGFEGWKLHVLGITFDGGIVPDCSKPEDDMEGMDLLAWPIEVSADETDERRDGKRVSQLMWPMLHKLRRAKRRKSARDAWPLHCTTIDIRTDSVTARSWSWSWNFKAADQEEKAQFP